jgi:aspartyl-tRNA(Asn)/glutamyl-tRNA(Gln) amidotransferase subunit C
LTEYWKIDRELVEHVAKVSRLELSDEELEKFTEQLKVILKAFKEMDEVDTEKVEPSFQPIDVKNVLREDSAEQWDWDSLGNAEHVEGRHFKGPRIT